MRVSKMSFPGGGQHYRIPLGAAEIVEAFTLTPEGDHVPLTSQQDYRLWHQAREAARHAPCGCGAGARWH